MCLVNHLVCSFNVYKISHFQKVYDAIYSKKKYYLSKFLVSLKIYTLFILNRTNNLKLLIEKSLSGV